MRERYPDEPKDQFDFLVRRAESYIRRVDVKDSSLKSWRNRAMDWLKNNAPTSGLTDAMAIIPAAKLQRGLAVLLQARPIVPIIHADPVPRAAPKPKNSKKVFIVHGRDERLKLGVADLVRRLGLEPIILHQQANQGRTIIEKFIDHSDVGYAVVLLTPDDRGGLADLDASRFQFRARQNVIFELGFFLGSLGRKRVAAIYHPDVEMLSDYRGVAFIEYDELGKWQFELAKEMRASGMPADMNKI